MIGVLASPRDLEAAAELFELFKTAWEPAVRGRHYDAVVSSAPGITDVSTRALLLFAPGETGVDRAAGVAVTPRGDLDAQWNGWHFPVWGPAATFPAAPSSLVSAAGGVLDYTIESGATRTHRIGYDLFAQVRHLLSQGQPERYAATPTLDLHIALLRRLLERAAVPFVEVLPRPAGTAYICCLTHDVDFIGLRAHARDRTLAGFLMRASIGTVADVVRGRRPASDLLTNARALLRVPLVLLGLGRDLWHPFDDYLAFEDPSQSTFFLVPFKDRPGAAPDGRIHPRRAIRYQIGDIAAEVRAAAARGSLIALHGIDAWRDADAGRAELDQVSPYSRGEPGVRMHWLYFDERSPAVLEAAGFSFDSTCGYNGCIGFRAGTSQVFRPPGSYRLLELPLAIMDSALLSTGRMALSQEHALAECRRILAAFRQFGGALVVNWHCRSIGPERLWGRLYAKLLEEIRAPQDVWFATASEAVAWFRWRRGIHLQERSEEGVQTVTLSAASVSDRPAVLRVHQPGQAHGYDLVFDGRSTPEVRLRPSMPVTA